MGEASNPGPRTRRRRRVRSSSSLSSEIGHDPTFLDDFERDGLQTIGVARRTRDGRDWHHQGVVPVAFQRNTQDGVLPFNGFQHGLLKQAPRVGEDSNPGPVETRSARRSAAAGDWDDESGPLAVAEPAQTDGECSRRAVRADRVRRPKRLQIQMPTKPSQ